MELQTISQVSKDYGISTRMLRYYEQAGLIKSLRKEDYSYRVYDEIARDRLQQIIILRKLRIPVKQIDTILKSEEVSAVIGIFFENIKNIDNEITALSAIRSILDSFLEKLRELISYKNWDITLTVPYPVILMCLTMALPGFIKRKTKEIMKAPYISGCR